MKRRGFIATLAAFCVAPKVEAAASQVSPMGLDDAVMACSTHRKLISTYTGPLFRARREDGAERDFYPGENVADWAGRIDKVTLCIYNQVENGNDIYARAGECGFEYLDGDNLKGPVATWV